jgi:thiol-disulfide isomerase/thioredoxin
LIKFVLSSLNGDLQNLSKMKTLKLFFLLVAVLMSVWVFGKHNELKDYPTQNKLVQFNIKGKEYEQMFMKVVSTTFEVNYITGKSTDNYRWTFNIPDSLSQNIWALKFYFTSNNDTLGISFSTVLDKDTLISPVNNFENNSNTLLIKGVFLTNDTVSHNDILKIDLKEKTYMIESLKYPGFALFYDPDNKKEYDDFVEDYKLKISVNPNSVYYISNLSAALNHFRSAADIKILFDLFSTSLQNSDHGKRISEYMDYDFAFKNLKLPIANNQRIKEFLIQDFTKYNLIELTASWCVWCHKIIPTLKEISEQYKDKLIITYVTVDDKKDILNFQKLIEKEQIIWRSLWLENEINNLLYKKSTEGIPCGILINPDGKIVDYFNFNRPKDLEKFHKILQGK